MNQQDRYSRKEGIKSNDMQFMDKHDENMRFLRKMPS